MWDLRSDRAALFEQVMHRPLVGSSFEQQLAFINYELTNSPVYSRAGDALRRAKTSDEAARAFAQLYEAMTRKEQPGIRAKIAADIYREFYSER